VLNGVGGAVVAVQDNKTNIEGEVASGHSVNNGECDEGLAISQFEKRIGLSGVFCLIFENFHYEIDLTPVNTPVLLVTSSYSLKSNEENILLPFFLNIRR